tara:strand:- start:398 stop:754 length:357 start_codon:yes stop_codon:yes gene_type:complete
MKDEEKFSPNRYSRACQTGWDNPINSQEKNVTVILTLNEAETLYQAALEGQDALRTNIDSMQSDPDVEKHEITHFRSKLYRNKAVLDEVEKRMTFIEKRSSSEKQGDFSTWEKLPSGF